VGKNFRTRPDWPWCPLSLLYNGYRVISEGKAAGAWRRPHTTSTVEVKNITFLYLIIYTCPSSGACDYSVALQHWSYCSWFDVCWSFGVFGLEWYPCCKLKHNLLFYFTSYVLNMIRTLIYPSSEACDYSVELPHWSYCSWLDVCSIFGAVRLEWYPCYRLKHNLLFYFTSYVLNIFRTLIYPSSGACDYSVELPHWS